MLSQSPQHKVVVYIGRIAVENNVQALIDAVENLDDSWHAMIIGPQCVPLEHIGPRVHLLPAQRRIGNWLGIADVLCHPSDYESHCFSINEVWLASVPLLARVNGRATIDLIPPHQRSALRISLSGNGTGTLLKSLADRLVQRSP